MNKEHVEQFISKRFGNTEGYYAEEWRNRFRGLDDNLIPHQMDNTSRRAWGKGTGNRYGLVKYDYGPNPTLVVVDLKTGKDLGLVKGEE